jgi:hypothetical protein
LRDYIRQHEGEPCKHCGAAKPGPEATCIARPTTIANVRPINPVKAADDYDFIGKRLAEIAAERQELAAGETANEVVA